MASTMRRAVQRQIIDALIAARKAAGLTQAELATRLGRSQSFVAKYEAGERRLDIVDFVVVCRTLGLSPATCLNELRL
jgi:transcriptional regulator with XRE-family HTH domain